MSPAFGAMEAEHYGKGVLLEPFLHQVGGHSCVLRFNDKTICKPLIQREHLFYETLPAEIRKFTPQYKGVVSVSFEEDEDGNLCLIAYPLNRDQDNLENVDYSDCSEPKSKVLRWSNKKALMLENDNLTKERVRQHRKEEKIKSHMLEEEFEWLKKSEVLYYSVEKKGNVGSQFKHNPWSMKCHQVQLQRMKENAKHRNQYSILSYLSFQRVNQFPTHFQPVLSWPYTVIFSSFNLRAEQRKYNRFLHQCLQALIEKSPTVFTVMMAAASCCQNTRTEQQLIG